jgi:hypothetical protein
MAGSIARQIIEGEGEYRMSMKTWLCVPTAATLGTLALPAMSQDDAARAEQARKLTATMVQSLGGQLQAAIKEGGPAGAIGVCTGVAPAIAGQLSRQNGVRLTRVSLKVRNPLLGSPDAWEQAALAGFEARLAKGEPADKLEFAETVTEPSGRFYRYMKALPVQPVCLNCHGDAASLTPEVRERLAQEYPNDHATGYSVGQIRGAVSVKRPL